MQIQNYIQMQILMHRLLTNRRYKKIPFFKNANTNLQLNLNTNTSIWLTTATKWRNWFNTNKHCQRHNGPRVWHLKLELSLQLNGMLLALVKIWPTCNANIIDSNFGHQVAIFALVTNLATRWRHFHYFSCKLSHQMTTLALVPILATRWRHLHWLHLANMKCI